MEKTEHGRCSKHAKVNSEADARLRAFLHRLFAESPRSKQQIAEALAARLGEPVSLARLDSFTAPKKTSARFPAYMICALAEALDSDAILLFLARPRTRKLLDLGSRVDELRHIVDDLTEMERKSGGA